MFCFSPSSPVDLALSPPLTLALDLFCLSHSTPSFPRFPPVPSSCTFHVIPRLGWNVCNAQAGRLEVVAAVSQSRLMEQSWASLVTIKTSFPLLPLPPSRPSPPLPLSLSRPARHAAKQPLLCFYAVQCMYILYMYAVCIFICRYFSSVCFLPASIVSLLCPLFSPSFSPSPDLPLPFSVLSSNKNYCCPNRGQGNCYQVNRAG